MKLLIFTILILSVNAFAGFGGSRSGGSYSGGSRSYSSGSSRSFGGSRSVSSGSSFGGSRSSSSVTISKPSSSSYSSGPGYYSRPSAIIHEVPVYHNSGNGFWTNFWMYQAVFGNRNQQPVVINQGAATAPLEASTIASYQQEERHGFFYYFFLILFFVGLAWALIFGWSKRKELF